VDSVFHLPVLNQVNRLLGSVAGAFTGIFAVFLICFLAGGLVSFLPDSAASFMGKSIDLSYIKLLTDGLNPFI
jgi:hypothetical protein